MIEFDNTNKQILSQACLTCKDEYFQPPINNMPKVGCCSYSPTFYLYEIAQMCRRDEQFFFQNILAHPTAEISPFSIKIHANTHPAYSQAVANNKQTLSKIEEDDLRLSYSTCQFFKKEEGCTLHPSFKNSVCRSFICLSIENSLTEKKKQTLLKWTKLIKNEEMTFQRVHEHELKQKDLTLLSNPIEVVHYFQQLQNLSTT
ncbi:hypothetical protein ACFFHM_20585 [Halalkalibacter kiskunsagensis]|uniref:YkgJ family cysteine cluster protein n=1 Tax=Halalkalibacter kiskunsagensis TaxID=1548599 RepID=A0ABV6KHR9_9BACI